ncbi:hypothetical protein [Peribacillus sp. NPDC097225]|uniref:hypothetical protein n=1 Tax=Peribacillus sp. NPDC097225 TaxID=3364400 RepID=UPI0037F771E5
MKESNKIINEFDIISIGVREDKKTITVYVPREGKNQNRIAFSVKNIAKEHAMEDFKVKVSAIKDGDPLVD